MIVELLSVGTEILLGNIVNTNAAYLSQKCAELGLSLYYEVTVGDNEQRVIEAITTALSRSDIIILTGGLGPTKDDLTKEMVAKAVGRSLVEDRHTREKIEQYFKSVNLVDIPESNWKQAMVIDRAIVVDNLNGTAPGQIVELEQGKRVILMPGPPGEMIPMFEHDIFPYLSQLDSKIIYSKMVKICGIGESKAESIIEDLIQNQTNPTIAPYAKMTEVHFRVTACSKTMEEAKRLIDPMLDELEKRFKENIYTTEESLMLEDVVIKLLKKHKLTVATAESCTGGMVSGKLVNVPGASDVFHEGFITYSNEAKSKYLNVKKETLDEFGAVSKETVTEMAIGAAMVSGSSASIAITGIAGPEGGTEEKPVGLIYIGCFVNGKTTVKECRFKGNRQKIREATVVQALDLLRRCILSLE